jgi:hypothetical protein
MVDEESRQLAIPLGAGRGADLQPLAVVNGRRLRDELAIGVSRNVQMVPPTDRGRMHGGFSCPIARAFSLPLPEMVRLGAPGGGTDLHPTMSTDAASIVNKRSSRRSPIWLRSPFGMQAAAK